MSTYQVKFTDIAQVPIEVDEDDVNKNLDIDLFGRIRLEYGQALNQNLLNLLENFACPADGEFGADLFPSAPDLSRVSERQLTNPVEGQFWYNSTNKHIYFWDSAKWVPIFLQGDTAANYGQIAHGQQLPRPISKTGYVFDINECIWLVSPAYIPGKVDILTCATDNSANVTMQYRYFGESTIVDGTANYLIIGIRGNQNQGDRINPPLVTPSPSPSPTPSRSATPPPSPTPTPTRTPAPNASPTPSPTPSPSLTRSQTPTPTLQISPTPSVTPSIGASQTPVASVTPTVSQTLPPSPTPTPTPSRSFVAPMVVELLTATLQGGYGPFSGTLSSTCARNIPDDGPLGCSFFDFQQCPTNNCAPEPGGEGFGEELVVRVTGGVAPYTVQCMDMIGTVSPSFECFYLAPSPINSLPTNGVFDTRLIPSAGGVAGNYVINGKCGNTLINGNGTFKIRVIDSSASVQFQDFIINWNISRTAGAPIQGGGGGGGGIGPTDVIVIQ